jgi:hypothetical protein
LLPPSSHTTGRTVPYHGGSCQCSCYYFHACCPKSTQFYLTDSVRYFQLKVLLRGICSRHSDLPFNDSDRFSPSSRIIPTTMASADFCLPIPSPYDDSSTWQVDRPPRVMHTHLHAYARRIYDHVFRTAIGL